MGEVKSIWKFTYKCAIFCSPRQRLDLAQVHFTSTLKVAQHQRRQIPSSRGPGTLQRLHVYPLVDTPLMHTPLFMLFWDILTHSFTSYPHSFPQCNDDLTAMQETIFLWRCIHRKLLSKPPYGYSFAEHSLSLCNDRNEMRIFHLRFRVDAVKRVILSS